MKTQKTIKILIPNATGPTNIGDQAILIGLLSLLTDTVPHAEIRVHSTLPSRYTDFPYPVKHSLYSYTVFARTGLINRIVSVCSLGLYYLGNRLGLTIPLYDRYLTDLLYDYKWADLIIFPGGGYLRSKPGISQTLNQMMILLMISLAKHMRAKTIMTPMSFGPYAYPWLENLAARTLDGLGTVGVREKYSLEKLRKHHVSHILLSTDTALFIPREPATNKRKQTIGFSIRDWLQSGQQAKFEKEFARSLRHFAVRSHHKILPIVQVDAPEFGDNDKETTQRIVSYLQNDGIKCEPLHKISNLTDAIKTYGSLDIMLGMRMHSNILAATQHVPFVAIAYEYKTQGISEQVGMKDFVLPLNHIKPYAIASKLHLLYKNKHTITKAMVRSVSAVVSREKDTWRDIFREYTA